MTTKKERHKPNPPYEPTPETRAQVEALTGFGIRQDEICKFLGITKPTLHKYFRKEIDTSVVKANAAVARSLHKQATEGNVAAAIFWLKSRAGWREKHEVEVSGPGGGPIQTLDATKLSDATLKELLSVRRTETESG